MWLESELGLLLQPGNWQAGRAAILRGRPGTAQAAGLDARTQAGRGRRAANNLLQSRPHLLAALCEGDDHHGQQHLQRQSSRRHLARQITWVSVIASFPPACGRPALYEKGGVSPTHCGEIVFLFLVRSAATKQSRTTGSPLARACFAVLAMTARFNGTEGECYGAAI